jgi:PKD repeat protein
MKTNSPIPAPGLLLSAFCLLLSTFSSPAATHYVDLASPNPTPPFTNWVTAATNIQEAVDASSPADTVLVTNGIYATGGRVVDGGILTNRVVITNGVVIASVNGPLFTAIAGKGPVGLAAVRCVFLAGGSVLSGFTLTNGHTLSPYDTTPDQRDQSGGGCYATNAFIDHCLVTSCEALPGGGVFGGTISNCVVEHNRSHNFNTNDTIGFLGDGAGISSAVVYDSLLRNNTADAEGGGAYECHLTRCTVTSNFAGNSGGGVSASVLKQCRIEFNRSWQAGGGLIGSKAESTLIVFNEGDTGGGAAYSSCTNCTIVGNRATHGGGARDSTLYNSILLYNQAASRPNHTDCSMSYTCSDPPPEGAGNVLMDPGFAAVGRLSATSNLRMKGGTENMPGTDLDGEPWRDSPAMGCDEPYADTGGPALEVTVLPEYEAVVAGVSIGFDARIHGVALSNHWDFGDGRTVTNALYQHHVWPSAGSYTVTVTAFAAALPSGLSWTQRITATSRADYFVDQSSPSPLAPFADWSTAATCIQDAVSIAIPGGVVWVSNGVYATGGMRTPGDLGVLTNRVTVLVPMSVRSMNGPLVTSIVGSAADEENAVRCVYLSAGSVLEGFTVTSGRTRTSLGIAPNSMTAIFLNACGGGAYLNEGTLSNCIVVGNRAAWYGGGVCFGRVVNSQLLANRVDIFDGGASFEADLGNCRIEGNVAPWNGGGACGGSLVNCLVIGNLSDSGGGVALADARNCTITQNVASNLGGGVSGADLLNCIIYSNTAPWDPNYHGSSLSYCCTTPLPTNGPGNIAGEPGFGSSTDTNYDLASTSPCVDAGMNEAWMLDAKDIDDRPRIMNGRVDMGAHEFRFEATLRCLLEGSYVATSDTMRLALQLPVDSPYATAPVSTAAALSNAVDWVLLSLRPTTTGEAVAAISACLRRDGMIVMPDGGETINLEAAGFQHIEIDHRNHLAAMSILPVFDGRRVSFDFSTNVSAITGGSDAMRQVAPGKWALIAGDADGDGRVTPVDRMIVTQQMGKTGYLSGDLNLDGVVNHED